MNLAESKRICLIAAMALIQLLSGCGWIISQSAKKDISQSLNINTFRNQIIDILGKPSNTVFYDKPREADLEIPEVSDELKHKLTVGYDDFMINGLVNTYKYEMSKSQAIDIYVGMSCITLGLFEIIATPVSIMDVIKKYNEKYLLRIWYDQEYRCLAYSRTKIEKGGSASDNKP